MLHCPDVVCPEIAIDELDPVLLVKWSQKFGIAKNAYLDIKSTYTEVDHWRLSVAATGVSTVSGGHVFLFPRDGFRQRFNISSNILEAGVSYEITVEGLQEIDDDQGDDSFMIICRNSTTLAPITLASMLYLSLFRL